MEKQKNFIVGVRIPRGSPGEFFEFTTKKMMLEFIKEIKKKDERIEIITAIKDGGV